MLSRFLHDRRGNIAMMFGLLSIPLIAATGAAVDYSRAYNQRMVVQDALDAASLAANRLIGSGTREEITAEAEAFFQANVQGRLDIDLDFATEIDGGTVTLTTELAVQTQFLGLIGINDITFELKSRTTAGAATYEVVLVLDNSTSMSGTKISTLRTAAANLVNTLFELNVSNPRPDPIRIGLVPFAASVNIGATSTTPPSWMDTTGASPRSALNFTTDAIELAAGRAAYGNTYTQATNTFGTFTNRFALWNTLRSVTYRGCVEARPYPYDVDDTAPDANTPATLFVPMFAPDEPGGAGNPTNNYVNSWLSDTGGVCSSTVPSYTAMEWVAYTYPNPCAGLNGRRLRDCQRANPNAGQTYYVQEQVTHTVPLTALQLQERVCKYQNVTVGSSYRGAGQGPNYNCTTTQVRALTTSQADLITWINGMQASGYTNIEEGVMWGWRLLSPTLPFVEGREYDDPDNRKILIIMTDGANTYNTNSSPNRSFYSAFGFVKANFLGTTSNNEDTVVSNMNTRTLEACQNIEDDTDIIVYTIAFQIPADQLSATQIMADCASDPSKAFDAANNTDLLEAFRLIGQDISTLRLAE